MTSNEWVLDPDYLIEFNTAVMRVTDLIGITHAWRAWRVHEDLPVQRIWRDCDESANFVAQTDTGLDVSCMACLTSRWASQGLTP